MKHFSIYFSPSDFEIYFFWAEMLQRILSATAGSDLSPLPVTMHVHQAIAACNFSCISQSSCHSSPALLVPCIAFQDSGIRFL